MANYLLEAFDLSFLLLRLLAQGVSLVPRNIKRSLQLNPLIYALVNGNFRCRPFKLVALHALYQFCHETLYFFEPICG